MKKQAKKKKVQVKYSKKWNNINLLQTVFLFAATFFTVALVGIKSFYDFRQRAQMAQPTKLLTPTPSVTPTPEESIKTNEKNIWIYGE
jgi:hypothetical protein